MPALNEEASAPYIPFRTFLNQIIKMEDGVPQRLDKSFLVTQPGGLHQPIIAAFRYFGFVDEQGLTQPSLHAVATAGDARDEHLAAIFESVYDWALKLGHNATQSQLDEAFKQHTGFTGSTLRKAVTFYLHAAQHLGHPLSKHFSAPRSAASGGANGRARPAKRKKAATGGSGGQSPPANGKRNYGDLHPLITSFIDTLIDQLRRSGQTFDAVAFDEWVDAFKKAAPLVPPVVSQPHK